MLTFGLVFGGLLLVAAWTVTRKGGQQASRKNIPMDLAAYRRRQRDGKITPEEKRRIVREIMRRREEDGFQ